MSWTKDITIWCDHDECAPEWIMSDIIEGRTVAATRRHARRLGWVYRDGKDLCPEHSGVARQAVEELINKPLREVEGFGK